MLLAGWVSFRLSHSIIHTMRTLVMQFFATVYFHNDTARILLLGCLGLMSALPKMAKFSEIIPYQFFAEEHDDNGHARETGRHKDEIAFAL